MGNSPAARWIFFILSIILLPLCFCREAEDKNQGLVKAIQDGNLALAEELIQEGADVNYRQEEGFGYTPLHHAVVHNHPDAIRLLTKNGADFAITDNNGYSPVHTSINNYRPECLEVLASVGAPLDAPGELCGKTPLFYAVVDNKHEAVKFLIQKGCNVHQVSDQGETLLHKAAFYGNRETCAVLIEHGLDPHLEDHNGKSPVDLAEETGDEACINILTSGRP